MRAYSNELLNRNSTSSSQLQFPMAIGSRLSTLSLLSMYLLLALLGLPYLVINIFLEVYGRYLKGVLFRLWMIITLFCFCFLIKSGAIFIYYVLIGGMSHTLKTNLYFTTNLFLIARCKYE